MHLIDKLSFVNVESRNDSLKIQRLVGQIVSNF